MVGNLFIVSAPSGAGKSSLVSAALAEDKGLALSVSYTTRPPRAGEVNGREYHFVERKTFDSMLERGLSGIGRSPWKPLWHLPEMDRRSARQGPGHPARNRLAGRPAGAQGFPRRGEHLHPSAAPGLEGAGAPAAGTRPGPRRSHPEAIAR